MLKISILKPQSILLLAFVTVLAAAVGLFMSGANYDWQGLLLVLAGIGILSVFLLPRMARGEGTGFVKILIVALLLKFVFAMTNYYFAFVVYGGAADVHGYSDTGKLISQYIWNFEFGKVTPFLQWSTNFIEFFTGVVYSIIGPSIFGGYLIYAFLSFLGSYFFYRAFRIAFPDGSKRLYMWLIFFFPPILFWPSAIGKDALMFLSIGLLAYGGSQIIQNQFLGLIPLTLGFLGALWVRPHIAIILILALALSFFLPGARKRPFRPAVYIIGLLVVGGLTWYLLPKVMAFLSLEELTPSGINKYLQQYQGLSYAGGSAFQAIILKSPVDYLMLPVNILFRPFLWETGNLQALMESLAGLFMLFLILWRIKSLGRALAASISNIYLRFILINIIIFVIIFTAISNFGTLARERVMMQPFLFMLISYGPLKTPEKLKQRIEGVYAYPK